MTNEPMRGDPANDGYLWDRTGAPDPEIEDLEKLLAPLRYRAPQQRGRPKLWWVAGIAAAAGLAAILLWPQSPESDWFVGGKALRLSEEVAPQAETVLEASAAGRVTLDGGSQLKIIGPRQFSLKQGTLHALIWAPPGEFIVDTPAAKAIDLGCQYTLQVDKTGVGLLTVETGWVAFQSEGRESFIPAGAACRTHPRSGPGIPFVQSASSTLQEAIEAFDQGDKSALSRVISATGREDGVTLWHLLTRTQGEERGRVYDRLAQFAKMPLRTDVVRGDAKSLDAAWDALGYGNTEWWRTWKHSWKPAK